MQNFLDKFKESKASGTPLQTTSSIGRHVLPIMQTLSTKLPNMQGAVLCSADGFNICSLGLEDMDVGRMASLSSSMFSMGSAIIHTLSDVSNKHKKELLFTVDSYQVVVIEVDYPVSDNLVLLVAIDNTSTGVVFMTVRKVVAVLEEKLKSLSNKEA